MKYFAGIDILSIFHLDSVLLPVNYKSPVEHWSLFIWNFAKEIFEYYDSAMSESSRKRFANLCKVSRDFLRLHKAQILREKRCEGINLRSEKFEFRKWGEMYYEKESPRQTDGTSCGVYLTSSFSMLSGRDKLPDASQWPWHALGWNDKHLRCKMCIELLECEIRDDGELNSQSNPLHKKTYSLRDVAKSRDN